jgi:hypothetical protein
MAQVALWLKDSLYYRSLPAIVELFFQSSGCYSTSICEAHSPSWLFRCVRTFIWQPVQYGNHYDHIIGQVCYNDLLFSFSIVQRDIWLPSVYTWNLLHVLWPRSQYINHAFCYELPSILFTSFECYSLFTLSPHKPQYGTTYSNPCATSYL